MRKLAEGKKDIPCVDCEKRIPLWDQMEELFADLAIQQRVHELQEQSKIVLDNESKERSLVGDVISTVALAAQISREHSVSDKGIDIKLRAPFSIVGSFEPVEDASRLQSRSFCCRSRTQN